MRNVEVLDEAVLSEDLVAKQNLSSKVFDVITLGLEKRGLKLGSGVLIKSYQHVGTAHDEQDHHEEQ